MNGPRRSFPGGRRGTGFRKPLAVGIGIVALAALNTLCELRTVAFVEVAPASSRGRGRWGRRTEGGRRETSIRPSLNERATAESPTAPPNRKSRGGATQSAGSNRDDNDSSNDNNNNNSSNSNNKFRSRQKGKNHPHYQSTNSSESEWVIRTLDAMRSPSEIKDWIEEQLRASQQQTPLQKNSSRSSWATWSIHEQVQFVKYLQQRGAYASILPFLSVLDFDASKAEHDENTPIIHGNRRRRNQLVKVYTTALFSIASRASDPDPKREHHCRLDAKSVVLEVLDRMDRNGVPATTLTYAAIFKNLRGRPGDVAHVIRVLERRERNRPAGAEKGNAWDAEVYNAAIYACRSKARHRPGRRTKHRDTPQESTFAGARSESNSNANPNTNPDGDSNKGWQTAIGVMQQMQRGGIRPTSRTYLAVLEVLGRQQRGSKLAIAKSIVKQWKTARASGLCDADREDRIWGAALNACAVAGDYGQALRFLNEMMAEKCAPNLRHCTALLKAISISGAAKEECDKGKLALTALDAMMGNETAVLEIPNNNNGKGGGTRDSRLLLLPRTDLDLVALNTVLSIVVRAGNLGDARALFDRIRRGDFSDSEGRTIAPDRITYHNLLAGSSDSETAKRIVKEMRLSRRNRGGAIPPTSVTYAHAISACQRANTPDLDSANQLLKWARDDAIQPTVFMYAAAIWTAQRCGNLSRCLELYEEMEASGCGANAVVLNGVLTALCDRGAHASAMNAFRVMKDRGFVLSPIALKRLVSVTTTTTTTTTTSAQTSKGNRFAEEEKEAALSEILGRLDPEERTLKIGSSVFEALILIHASRGDIDEALSVANQINGCLDAACLRAILLAYSRGPKSRWSEAVELLHTTIIEESPEPGKVDQLALSHTLTICSRANEFAEGLTLLGLYGIPVRELPEGCPQLSIVALNALIAACGRCGRPDLSLVLLNEISSRYGLRPDGRSYRSAMIACNKAQHAESARRSKLGDAEDLEEDDEDEDDEEETDGEYIMEWWECSLALYRRMAEGGLKPDVQTHSSIISSCEAAGEWQRALWVLQKIIDESSDDAGDEPPSLNLYCWNAALSACEKGGAWVEALDLYERMLQSPFRPNVVTVNSLMEALDKAGQKELAQSIYDEALELGILRPWKKTADNNGKQITALDLHNFSESMARAAVRKTMDSWLDEKEETAGLLSGDFVIITGKGIHSASRPVLREATKKVLRDEYGIKADADKANGGRIVIERRDLLDLYSGKSWR